MKLTAKTTDEVIDLALAEDLGAGDITTDALISDDWSGRASFVAKAEGVLAGIEIAGRVFRRVDSTTRVEIFLQDGARLTQGDMIGAVTGRLSSIFKAERTGLNFLQHLSGIASETARYVAAVNGLPVKILDTRKTLPGLRALEKHAVLMGGGQNHRMHLGDGVLIKDNHLEALYEQGFSLNDIIAKARQRTSAQLKIEVEARTLDETRQAAEAGADIILLDNMSPEVMRQAVKLIDKRALVEASGGITLANARAVAESGVDLISVGALTHSAKALDISLEFETPD